MRTTALALAAVLTACQTTATRENPITPRESTAPSPVQEATPPVSAPQTGQDPLPDDWRFHAGIYMWGAGIDGTATSGNVGVPINESFSDILDNLEFAAMAAFEGKKGQWGFRLDGIYMDLEGSGQGLAGTIDTRIETLVAEADVLFSPRGNPGLDFLAGVRVLGIDTEIDFPLAADVSGDETFVDPIIGAQGTWDLGEDWMFRLRGDVGGFGASSELTYQFLGFFRWGFAESWGLDFGYRMLGYDVDKGDVDLDVRFQGLIVGVDYAF